MIIMGIDPGLATVGFGFIDAFRGRHKALEYGAVLTPAGPNRSTACGNIRKHRRAYQGSTPGRGFHRKAVLQHQRKNRRQRLSGARRDSPCLRQKWHSVFEYTPLQIKQAVVGQRRASKKQVMYMVTRLLNLKKEPHPDDTADALAAALCHSFSADSALFGLT